MRANAAKREPELQKFWADERIYETLSEQNPGELFILHDGPPYANGALHMGHTLNKVLKDIINKYQILKGRKVRYVPGWDCHGLPIELKVLQEMKPEERRALTPLELRQRARAWAEGQVDQQCESFKKLGVWGDWEHPYLTMQPEYEAAQIHVFGQMALKGYIYRGFKPVYWSPSSRTALAEAELEYPDLHTSRSVYAAFPVVSLPDSAQAFRPYQDGLGVAIWTTTPWTLPANLAVAVNPELTYAVVKVEGDSAFQHLLVAKDLVPALAAKLGLELTVEAELPGKALEHSVYQHPLFERQGEILIGGDYVTTESGTGLVHTAPGHGVDDFLVGQRYGLPVLSPVDDGGKFMAEAGQFAGLQTVDEVIVEKGKPKFKLSSGNAAVIQALEDSRSLLKQEAYDHRYPYDWRTKQPVMYRATEQWFASVDGFRDAALKAISEVTWIPAQGENRITAMVSERSDWCISRQRSWGVPIPVFYDEETNEPLLNEATLNHIENLFAKHGSDAWWELPISELLPEPYRSNGRSYRKGTDTMDVWFDSGSSWASVVEQRADLGRYPVDLYLEGSDQHRGWFQSSLLTSVAVNGHAPFKSVLTHGFTVDEEGNKMSKSLGNGIDPMLIIQGGSIKLKGKTENLPAYGSDVLRLWVSSVDYSKDVPLSLSILKQINDSRGKIRNTARFLLGNLNDFDPAKDAVPYEELPELDRYMLHRMTEVFAEATDAFETYQFFRFFQTIQNFCVVDLSNFYLDIAKDRLYISAPNAARRRSCQTVLAVALENLARSIAPVLSHLAEDIWQFLPYKTPYKSVFEAGWVNLPEQYQQPDLAQTWEQLRQIRDQVNLVLEKARSDKAIGSSLAAKVLLYVSDSDLKQTLLALNPDSLSGNGVDELRYLLLTSQVEVLDQPTPLADLKYQSQSDALGVGMVDAAGEKCDRCWNYSTHVGKSAEHPLLCERCVEAVAGKF
ncbi:MAG: isoleucine--tRNA ligase [Elainella sp.]